jgi:hypothetical protein
VFVPFGVTLYENPNSYPIPEIDETDGPLVNDEFKVYALPGRAGTVIGRHRTGKIILFNKENPISSQILSHTVVLCRVVSVNIRSIIVEPLEAPSDDPSDVIATGLELVMETNPHPHNTAWEMQIIARALHPDF